MVPLASIELPEVVGIIFMSLIVTLRSMWGLGRLAGKTASTVKYGNKGDDIEMLESRKET